MRTSQVGAVAVAAVLALGACGGGSDGATSDGGAGGGSTSGLGDRVALSAVDLADGEGDDDVAGAAARLVDDLGEEAIGAVLLALDRGYDADQIVIAASVGGVAADGTITEIGEEMVPADFPVGVFEETTADEVENGLTAPVEALVAGLAGGDVAAPKPLSEVTGRLSGAEASDEVLLIMILSLSQAGYDIEQITEAIILDSDIYLTSRLRDGDEPAATDVQRLCPVLGDGDRAIVPANVDGSRCKELFDRLGVTGRDVAAPDERAAGGDPADGGSAGGDGSGDYLLDQVIFENTHYTATLDVAVDGGEATASGQLSVDYGISYHGEDLVCSSAERYTIAGTGTVAGDELTLPIGLANVSAELTGSDCSDSAQLQAENIATASSASFLTLTGAVDGDVLVGTSPEAPGVALEFTRAG